MKKILFLLVLACFALNANSFAEVQDEIQEKPQKQAKVKVREELVPPINPEEASASRTEIGTLRAKVNDLERRLNDIDRDRRFEQDRVRQLDRDVNDIKRRF